MADTGNQSELRGALSGQTADLYDQVSSQYPRFEDGWFTRKNATRDDAFRHLLRAVIEDTPEPRGWFRHLWPDEQVIRAAHDPEIRQGAWALLEDESPHGWRETWAKRNAQDRIYTRSFLLVGALVLLGVLAWNLLR